MFRGTARPGRYSRFTLAQRRLHDLSILHSFAARGHHHLAGLPGQHPKGARLLHFARRGTGKLFLIYEDCSVQDSTEAFFRKVRFWGGGTDAPPLFQIEGVSYLHVKVLNVIWPDASHAHHSKTLARQQPLTTAQARLQEAGLLLAAATTQNVSPALVLELLKRIGGIIKVPASVMILNPRTAWVSYGCAVLMLQSHSVRPSGLLRRAERRGCAEKLRPGLRTAR